MWEKGENAGYHHFLLFPQYFQKHLFRVHLTLYHTTLLFTTLRNKTFENTERKGENVGECP